MSDAKRKEIIDAIKKALTLLNVKYEIGSENELKVNGVIMEDRKPITYVNLI